MFSLVVISILVLLYLAFVGGYLRFDKAHAIEQVTRLAGGAMLVVAAFLMLIGRELAGAATALIGLTIIGGATDAISNMGYYFGRRIRATLAMVGLVKAPLAGRSTVRSAALEVEVDPVSGVISGRVLAGSYEGRSLARLSMAELAALRREIARDPESFALLEAYLDRRAPGWREDLQFDPAFRQHRAASSGAMTDQEAYQILGLQPGAGEAEIRETHRRLMKAVHPDVGGSAFLAAKINEAKDRLIGKHRTRSNY